MSKTASTAGVSKKKTAKKKTAKKKAAGQKKAAKANKGFGNQIRVVNQGLKQNAKAANASRRNLRDMAVAVSAVTASLLATKKGIKEFREFNLEIRLRRRWTRSSTKADKECQAGGRAGIRV